MAPNPTLIYHITHVDNLLGILREGGLLPCSELSLKTYTNIANKDIQDRRRQFVVPIEPGGNLHDYVPFYFAPLSPMLYSISRNNVVGYDGGQRPIVYLVSSVEAVISHGLKFVFTDGHAIMHVSNYFNSPEHLNRIDWSLMRERYWNDTADDRDRKRRRMAEFLVHKRFPWQLVARAVAFDVKLSGEVACLFRACQVPTTVEVNSQWYY